MPDPVMQNSSSLDTPKSSKKGLVAYTIVALGLALFIRFFIAAPYVVSGASMEPGFDDWNYLIVDRLSYNLTEPKRGDVIVFDLPQNESRALIKRVIGLPGETVRLSGQTVTILNAAHPEGFTLDEPYLDPENLTGNNFSETALEKDEYFVLGDNRHVSADSRIWGSLPRSEIVGRVFMRLYPLDEIGILPGASSYAE
ncbi:signal peptidase I [Candidatus Kaiserbacteria bacterium RIFCSPHIGHO2_01_FULL_54_36]|uniref:Signal peptidase I n=1 Tax=Candidatus Kaiserbacteria bacterium RIFCSPHIGHO2_01_FULL_54_36 TaxID=1798482 RepID=A0A1F6CMU0_9BACT|nr:MAG: signal peptidase I [Candidatus Kaiserbacteria bacterium RIFCSPHIGHO2_01_FULL_54_36]OGG75333.1 MAG: signal peptidase I [Candidatus Kaiserbacteria bacterium RIFCSPLOWO2_01_FULL_54_22]